MKKTLLIFAMLIIALADNNLLLSAGDTIIVQTFTYDSITGRRGTWDFPENSEDFRKILLLYNLKCDPRTTQDKYNCGEWDYLTYNVVYKPTGKMDSTLYKHPYFKVGSEAPDTLFYTDVPAYNKYIRYLYSIVYDKIESETKFPITTGVLDYIIKSKPTRIQTTLLKQDLKSSGLVKGQINKLILTTKQSSDVVLYDFKVKIKAAFSLTLESFDNNNLQTVFHNNIQFLSPGENEINFTKPYDWNGNSNLLIEISYNSDSEEEVDIVLVGNESGSTLTADGKSIYLYFDGKNDYIDCGNIEEFNGTKNFTIEGWFNIQEWKPWAKLMGKGSQVTLECGSSSGSIYAIIRNPNNTYGYSSGYIQLNTWNHIAMVFDGTKLDNASKLKLYINGQLVALTFSGDIPDVTPNNQDAFTFTSLSHSTSALNGFINEVRLWSEPLDSATIADWWNIRLSEQHPNYSKLIAYYPMNESNGVEIINNALENKYLGKFIGTPEWKLAPSDELFFEPYKRNFAPNITFVQGTYQSHLDSTRIEDLAQIPPISIEKFDIINRKVERTDLEYVYKAGWSYTFDNNNVVIDSIYTNFKSTLINKELSYYGEPFPITDQYEIGRFITPYGINLDLGPDGFNWMYDVTDYAHLLKGKVDLSAGNQQELIDMKFLFIKGDPPRKVVKHDRIWGQFSSYSYKNLSDNTSLAPKKIAIDPNATSFKVKTRLTGHGHNSNNGQYPHCCEWKNNTHYLYINGKRRFQWNIWRDNCGLNPVFPQGGTWPGSREGWCPGDVVYDYDFDITSYVQGDSVEIDYDITKVPEDNLGMGNGNYVVSMELFQYSEPPYQLDAEVYDVITPNNWEYYSRKNPICSNPTVVIRNNSTQAINSLKFDYNTIGGTAESYNWSGAIEPFQTKEISLPISSTKFWLNDGTNRFEVRISKPNGHEDEYVGNNYYLTDFTMPDLHNKKLVLWYQTNNRPQDFSLEIKDFNGNVVLKKQFLSASTLYKDTLNFPDGCYTLELIDYYSYGLSYWAYPEQGSGFLRLQDLDGSVVKVFKADCGRGITYSFSLGEASYVQDKNYNDLINLFPNPSQENVKLLINYSIGYSSIEIYNIEGTLLYSEKAMIGDNFEKQINTSGFSTGTYIVRIKNDKFDLNKQFIKK